MILFSTRGGDVTQLVDCVPCMYKAMDLIPSTILLVMVVHTPALRKEGEQEQGVQSHPWQCENQICKATSSNSKERSHLRQASVSR